MFRHQQIKSNTYKNECGTGLVTLFSVSILLIFNLVREDVNVVCFTMGVSVCEAYCCRLWRLPLDAELCVSAVVPQGNGFLTDVTFLLIPAEHWTGFKILKNKNKKRACVKTRSCSVNPWRVRPTHLPVLGGSYASSAVASALLVLFLRGFNDTIQWTGGSILNQQHNNQTEFNKDDSFRHDNVFKLH